MPLFVAALGEGDKHDPPEGDGAHPKSFLAAGSEIPAAPGRARRLQPLQDRRHEVSFVA